MNFIVVFIISILVFVVVFLTVEFSILEHGFQILFTGAHEQNYPICIFHLVQGHDFVITRKKIKYAYVFIFNLFFRNLNVLSKAKPILKTL